jgi:hypothetical protein
MAATALDNGLREIGVSLEVGAHAVAMGQTENVSDFLNVE